MKLFKLLKDGGPESKVDGYFLIEIKWLFTIVLLHFHPGYRPVYHTHAFNAVSWMLRGWIREFERYDKSCPITYAPSVWPIWTPRSRCHMVKGLGHAWALSFRGPWAKTWMEYDPETGLWRRLEHGRVVTGTYSGRLP